jgi:soluble lytic murein transglycosylase-like protein
MSTGLHWVGWLLAVTLANSANAGLYGYVDDQGIIHLANHKLNPHFQLFKKPLSTSQNRGPRVATASASAPQSTALPASDTAPPPTNTRAASRFSEMITHTASQFQLDQRLLHSIIAVESGYNPNAVSPKGAIGLMQVMPATGRRFGITNLSDPQQNLIAGASYLRTLLLQFNANLPLVIAAYNAGEGAVQKYGNTIPPFNETRSYVSKVMSTYQARPSLASLPEYHFHQNKAVPHAYGHTVLILRGDQPPPYQN